MKWSTQLNGEGLYWWEAKTPIGPFHVSYLDSPHFNSKVIVEWYPFDLNEVQVVAGADTEDSGKAAAEAYVKALAKKLKRWVK